MSSSITPTDLQNAKIDAQNYAEVANSRSGGTSAGEVIDTTTNRAGDIIDTVRGRLKKLGYQAPVAYASSISFAVDDGAKTVTQDGLLWAPVIQELPFTTTGTWVGGDKSKFYPVPSSFKLEYDATFDDSAAGLVGQASAGALTVNDVVEAKGSATKGDGGNAKWQCISYSAIPATPDNTQNVGTITISWRNGNFWVPDGAGSGYEFKNISTSVCVEQFGFDEIAVQSAANFSNHSQRSVGFRSLITVLPDSIDINGKVSFFGGNKYKNGLVLGGDGGHVFSLQQGAELSYENLAYYAQSNSAGLISGSSDDSDEPIQSVVRNCHIDTTGCDNDDIITMVGYRGETRIQDNDFIGPENPTLSSTGTETHRCVVLPDNNYNPGQNAPCWIENNWFVDGYTAFDNGGTNRPGAPLFYINNHHYGCKGHIVTRVYHGVEWTLSGNVWEECGNSTITEGGNDAGIVWLDISSPVNVGSMNGFTCAGNVVKNCIGNGVFAEELWGNIEFTCLENRKRTAAYTGSTGRVSYGGNGIVVTGGSRQLTLNVQSHGNEAWGVVIDRTLGVDTTLNISCTFGDGLKVSRNQYDGVSLGDKIRHVSMSPNIEVVGNGLEDPTGVTTQYAAIRVHRHGSSTQQLKELRCAGRWYDEDTTNGHYYGLLCEYGAQYRWLQGVDIETTGGEWVKCANMNGSIENCRLRGARGFDLSGTGYSIGYNSGYTVINHGVESVTGTETITHGLGDGTNNLTPYHVDVRIQSGSNYNAVADNFTSTSFDVTCYDADTGTVLTVSRSVEWTARHASYRNR